MTEDKKDRIAIRFYSRNFKMNFRAYNESNQCTFNRSFV